MTRRGDTKRSRNGKKTGKATSSTKEADDSDDVSEENDSEESEEEEAMVVGNTILSPVVGGSTTLASTPSFRLPSVNAGGLVDGLETVLFHLRRQRQSSTDELFRASLLPAEQLLAPALFGVQAAAEYLSSLQAAGFAPSLVDLAQPGYRALEDSFQRLLPAADVPTGPGNVAASFYALELPRGSNSLGLRTDRGLSSTVNDDEDIGPPPSSKHHSQHTSPIVDDAMALAPDASTEAGGLETPRSTSAAVAVELEEK